MQTQRTALVIGANGGIGRETTLALLRHGWRVRALVRTPPAASANGVAWLAGDAMQAQDVRRAAEGAQVIVHAVNPPGYRGWAQQVLPMLDNTLAAARESGARVVLPGTIYNYGPDAFPLLREDSPQHPTTDKGAIRVAMERRLQLAASEGTRVLIARCGDFFGPRVGNNWFAQGLMRPGTPVTRVLYPGDLSLGHAWAYLPDVADIIARLLEREAALADFERFHVGGHWLDGNALIAAIRRAAGDEHIRAGRFPWWLMHLSAPFNVTMRELREMRYLWREPLRLDDSRLRAFLGPDLYTPIDDAVRATLEGMGCLPARADAKAPSRA